MEERWRRAITGEASGPEVTLARTLLTAAAGPYLLALKANLALYQRGLLRRREPALPTVSVGNLALGGTGKTTSARHLARHLLAAGLCPAIVLRGHKRRRGPPSLLVSDENRILSSLAEAGDEALMLARTTPGCPVAVGKRREAVIRLLAETTGARVALLDDGFQYFRMRRICDLVLLDATCDLARARLFPGGRLREPVSHLSRATHILLTHTDLVPRTEVEATVQTARRHNPTAPVMHSRHLCTGLYRLDRPNSTIAPREVAGLSVVALSAVGNPASFAAAVLELGAELAEQVTFPDHHHYLASDWRHVRDAVRTHDTDCVVVTEKDAVKLPPVPADLPPVLVLVADLEVTHGEGEWEALLASVEAACDEHAPA